MMKSNIVEHLSSLAEEFQRYYPDLDDNEGKIFRIPFTSNLSVHKLLIYTVDKLPQTIKDDVVA
jgi:hypothetical protein